MQTSKKNQGLFKKGLRSLIDNKVLDLAKLKAFADDKFTVGQVSAFFSLRRRNTFWEKEKMLVNRNFSYSNIVLESFYQELSKACLFNSLPDVPILSD